MLGDGAIELYTYSSGRCVKTLLKHINNQLNTNHCTSTWFPEENWHIWIRIATNLWSFDMTGGSLNPKPLWQQRDFLHQVTFPVSPPFFAFSIEITFAHKSFPFLILLLTPRRNHVFFYLENFINTILMIMHKSSSNDCEPDNCILFLHFTLSDPSWPSTTPGLGWVNAQITWNQRMSHHRILSLSV